MSYNKNELLKRKISATAMKLAVVSLISAEQLQAILGNYKITSYSPSLFVRIGLFYLHHDTCDCRIRNCGNFDFRIF